MTERTLELGRSVGTLDSDGVIRIRVGDQGHAGGDLFDEQESRNCRQLATRLSGSISLGLVLCDMTRITRTTRKARQFSPPSTAKGMALLVSTSASRLLGTAYLALTRPKIPTKVFLSDDEATRWLLDLVD